MPKIPLQLTHPVLGVRLWQSLAPYDCPQYENMMRRWYYSMFKENRLYGLLQSNPYSREWQPGVNVAKCASYNKHVSPQHSCTCGLYAYHDLDCLFGDYAEGDKVMAEPWILGLVRGWGTVYCHPNGWRAEKAEILALFGDWGPYPLKRKKLLAEAYQVPLLTKQGLPAIMSEFGTPIPYEMRPTPA